MTDAVVISGAAAVPVGGAPATALLTVPELVDVAIADPGTGVELIVHDLTGAPLRIAVEDVGDIAIPAGGRAVVPLRADPDGARLHLQAMSTARSQVVMVMVGVEPSDDGPIAVGQGIGAPTC